MSLRLEEVCQQLEALVTAAQSWFKTVGTCFSGFGHTWVWKSHSVGSFPREAKWLWNSFCLSTAPVKILFLGVLWTLKGFCRDCLLWILHQCCSCGFNKSKNNVDTPSWEGPTRTVTPNKPSRQWEEFLTLLSPLQAWRIPRFPCHGISPRACAPSSSSTSSGRNCGAEFPGAAATPGVPPSSGTLCTLLLFNAVVNHRGLQGKQGRNVTGKGDERKSRQAPKQVSHKYFLTLHRVKTEDLERSWRNQLGVCIALSSKSSGGFFLWIKIWNFPVEKDLSSEGKSLLWGKGKASKWGCTDTSTCSLSRCRDVPKDFAALYQSKLTQVEFIFHLGWILCQFPVWNSTNVDLFHSHNKVPVFCPFFFCLKWIPALSSAGAEQKPLQFCVFNLFINDFCLASFHVLTAVCKV